jgi:hypothetical protein
VPEGDIREIQAKLRNIWKEKSALFLYFIDFFLDVLPHVAVESDGELTERTGEDSPFYQLRYEVFLFSTTDRARKG